MAFEPRRDCRWLGLQAQGDVGPLTLYTDKRQRIVAFPQAPPKDPPSWRQTHYRNQFRMAALYWQRLTPPQKKLWQRAARRASLGIGGYALFVYRATTRDAATIRTIERQSSISLPYPGP